MATNVVKLIEYLESHKKSDIIESVLGYFKQHKLGDITVELGDEVNVKFSKTISDTVFKKVVESIVVNHFLKSKIQEFKLLSETDDVTMFYNQRRLYSDLEELILKSKKKKTKFSVLFIDVDKFKLVNDQFGHLVGSVMLQDMAGIIKKIVNSPYLYRYGGDEFIVFLDGLDTNQVVKIAEEISSEIKSFKFIIKNYGEYKLSVSIGVCEYPTDAKTFEEVIDLADKMMYESKKKGRGKVTLYKQVQKKVV